MIVIDASSLAKYIVKEEGWTEVEKYLIGEEVHSVDLIVKEVLNVIWKYSTILKVFPMDVAIEKYTILKGLVDEGVIILSDERPYLEKAFNIATRMRITIYDALYIAQAIELRTRLLTSDESQMNAARNLGLEVTLV